MTNNQIKTGECECCEQVNVTLTLRHGNTWMCEKCWAEEEKVINHTNNIVQSSQKTDETIQIRTDLFNAATVASVELKAAIDNDEAILPADKAFAYTSACYDRFTHLKQVIFEDRQALLAKENELRMWQMQAQQSAATLRQEQRDKFKALDINYQPAKPKTVKPKSIKTPSKAAKFDKKGIYAAIEKYKLDASAAPAIQALALARGVSPDDAAKQFVEMMQK